MTVRLECKADLAVSDAGEISGIAWAYGVPDRVGDVIEKGAFADTRLPVTMLFGHDQNDPIGVWTEVVEQPDGQRGRFASGALSWTPGAINVLQAAPGTPVEQVLGRDQINANPSILGAGKTVDDVVAYGQRRAGATMLEATALERLGTATDTATLKTQLLAAAQAAGLALTPDLVATIDQLAAKYGSAATEAQNLELAQEEAQERAADWAHFGGSLVSGFIDDLRQGKSASEALANALNRVVDQLLDMAIQALVVKPLMNALTGGLGGFLGFSAGGAVPAGVGLYAAGGKVNGPGTGTSDSIPAMLSDGEHVINARSARKHRALLEAINADRLPAFAAGGAVDGGMVSRFLPAGNQNAAPVINTTINVTASGGTEAQNQDLAKQIGRQVEASTRAIVAQELRQRLRPGGSLR